MGVKCAPFDDLGWHSMTISDAHPFHPVTQFSKLCRDCKLVNGKSVSHAVVDIIYYRWAPKMDPVLMRLGAHLGCLRALQSLQCALQSLEWNHQ